MQKKISLVLTAIYALIVGSMMLHVSSVEDIVGLFMLILLWSFATYPVSLFYTFISMYRMRYVATALIVIQILFVVISTSLYYYAIYLSSNSDDVWAFVIVPIYQLIILGGVSILLMVINWLVGDRWS